MNYKKYFIMILIISLPLILFSGCNVDNSTNPEYKIEFTLDGTQYLFTSGYSETGGAEGCMRDDGDTFIAARNADDPSISIYLRFKTTTPTAGTYIENETDRCFNFNNGSTIYYDDTNLDDFSFIITEYGNVNGIIKGTFQGVIQEPEPHNITNGVFEVKRKADNTVGSGG